MAFERRRRSRRAFCAAVGAAGLAGLAGCTGGSDVEDTDGDGVVDSADYAPRDANVSRKSDLDGSAPAAKPTTTPTDTTTPASVTATPAPTRTETAAPSTLAAKNAAVLDDDTSYVSSYGRRSVTVELLGDDRSFEGARGKDLLVLLSRYPRGEILDRARTTVDVGPGERASVTVSPTVPDSATDEPLQYLAVLVPESADFDDLPPEEVEFFHETDPFVVAADGTLERAAVAELADVSDDEGDGYARVDAEGMWLLTLDGRTDGTDWQARFYVYKSVYVRHRRADHGRGWAEFVTYETTNGTMANWARVLSGVAADIGFSDKRTQAEFVIDFVQSLPYVPDDVSTGYDDYTKFTVETLAELGGDCEDTSILLAGVLQADPFGYDTVLIQPPGHMAVGIYGTDLPGTYWTKDGRDYYYLETTGEGWGVGDLPNAYRGESAYVYQV